jgi:hypothetical protein
LEPKLGQSDRNRQDIKLRQNYMEKRMDLSHFDRIYRTIDAKIGRNKFMRILSKIDKDSKIVAEFYSYHEEDIDKDDGTIKNKRNRYITECISIVKFNDMIDKFSLIYPEFEIIGMSDFSNMTLKESVETIKSTKFGKIIHYDN